MTLKKYIVLFLILFMQTVYAEDALDVFEEYAGEKAELVTYRFQLTAQKNRSVEDALKFDGNGEMPEFEIVRAPKKGTLSLNPEDGTFCYTPDPDRIGSDCFLFRAGNGEEYSNISECSIEISDGEPVQTALGFVYTDLEGHWVRQSAARLVQEDVMKGERIGADYYFHPNTQMTRLEAVSGLLSCLKQDFMEVSREEAAVFSDSSELPDYMNQIAYRAKKLGLLRGDAFHPKETVTRAEVFCMIDRAMADPAKTDLNLNYTDARLIPGWAVQSVKNLTAAGVLKGYEDGTVRPNCAITRAELSELLCGFLKNQETAAVQTVSERIKQGFYGKIVI